MTELQERFYKHIIHVYRGKNAATSAKQIASEFNGFYGLNINATDVQHLVKYIREHKLNYTVKSIPGVGYYVMTSRDTDHHNANMLQFLGLAKSIMKSGEYKKGYIFEVLRHLESEVLSDGQIRSNGEIYERFVKYE